MSKFQSMDDINRAIETLRKRVKEVKALDGGKYAWGDQAVTNVEHQIRKTIFKIFGGGSLEYRQNQGHHIFKGRSTRLGLTPSFRQNGLKAGIPESITMLEGLISILEEKKEDFKSDLPARAYDSFQGLHLHPRITEVADSLFKSGHYSEAIFEASKALVRLIQDKSGRTDLDGSSLMDKVFSPNNPILAFPPEHPGNNDEQQGMMFLYKGIVLGVRNPKAHNVVMHRPSPHRALEYLAMISLLAKRLDDAVLTST